MPFIELAVLAAGVGLMELLFGGFIAKEDIRRELAARSPGKRLQDALLWTLWVYAALCALWFLVMVLQHPLDA